MEVVIKSQEKSVSLSSIKNGEVFKILNSGDSLNRYMRITTDGSDFIEIVQPVQRVSAVCLSTGRVICPINSIKVVKVEAKVVCDD